MKKFLLSIGFMAAVSVHQLSWSMEEASVETHSPVFSGAGSGCGFPSSETPDEVTLLPSTVTASYDIATDDFSSLLKYKKVSSESVEEFSDEGVKNPGSKNLSSIKFSLVIKAFLESPQGRCPIQDIFTAAQQIKNLADDQKPEVIFGLGRFPTTIMAVLENIYSADPKRPIMFSLPFSGSPDIATLNHKSLEHAGLSSNRNVLLEKGLRNFFALLDRMGFESFSGKRIWMIDTVTFGGGLNSFMRLLLKYYYQKEKTFPHFNLVALCDKATRTLEGEKNGVFKVDKENVLSFSSNKDNIRRGYKRLSMPLIKISLPTQSLEVNDNDFIEGEIAAVSEYPAFKMNHDDSAAPGPLHTDFVEYFIKPMIISLSKFESTQILPEKTRKALHLVFSQKYFNSREGEEKEALESLNGGDSSSFSRLITHLWEMDKE